MKLSNKELEMIWNALTGRYVSYLRSGDTSLAHNFLALRNRVSKELPEYNVNPAEKNMDVAIGYLDDEPNGGNDNFWYADDTLYSYKEPIAQFERKNEYITGIWVNKQKYTATTSKHQGYLRRALIARGLKDTNKARTYESIYYHQPVIFTLWK